MHYEKIMRFKKSPQLPGAGRTREWHYHGSHTPTSPGAILLGKMAYHTKQIRRECMLRSVAIPNQSIEYLALNLITPQKIGS